MSTCVNTIKQLLGALVFTFVLTYGISLNIENYWVVIDSKWISNDFLFAIAGGAFASLLIVLVCELIKYRQLKVTAENTLFMYFVSLYWQILIIRSNCKRVLNSQDTVANNLIQSDNAAILADRANEIDYAPLCKNKVAEVLSQFKSEKYGALKSVITDFLFLQIALGEDKISLIQQGKSEIVRSDAPNVNKALNKIVSQTSTILTYLDQIISQIDKEFKNRYNWQNTKKSMNNYQDTFVSRELADYLNEDVIVF